MKNAWIRRWAAMTMALAAVGASAQSIEMEGVKLDATVQVGTTSLQLNGVGLSEARKEAALAR